MSTGGALFDFFQYMTNQSSFLDFKSKIITDIFYSKHVNTALSLKHWKSLHRTLDRYRARWEAFDGPNSRFYFLARKIFITYTRRPRRSPCPGARGQAAWQWLLRWRRSPGAAGGSVWPPPAPLGAATSACCSLSRLRRPLMLTELERTASRRRAPH